MIDLHDLTPADIGRWVVYRSFNKTEAGRLKSWNQSVIWVVYKCNNDWDRFLDFTGEPTDPKDLEFKDLTGFY